MNIPRAWAKVTADCQTRDNRKLPVAVWGWARDEVAARREASDRLGRLIERIRRGEAFPDAYAHGSRPLREEILQVLDWDGEDQPYAVLTRNRYGATVLKTTRLLFLDIGLPSPTLMQRLRRLFAPSRSCEDEAALAKLHDALRQFGRAAFCLYRTAAGFRAIAIDREFDPGGRDTHELMTATGTDPAFMRLCVAQQSFRARLTAKPWRCHCLLPPGQHPRMDGAARQRFSTWLGQYELAARKYAACRYMERIGSRRLKNTAEQLVALHDRVTRCGEPLRSRETPGPHARGRAAPAGRGRRRSGFARQRHREAFVTDAELQAWWPALGAVVAGLRSIDRPTVADLLVDAVLAGGTSSEILGNVGIVLRDHRALCSKLSDSGGKAWDSVMADVDRAFPGSRLGHWFGRRRMR
jgi:hypothetical protein